MAKPVAFVEVIGLVIIICMVNNSNGAEMEALTCKDVNTKLSPCVSYVRGHRDLTRECCNGFQTLVDAFRTKDDRQTACGCFKDIARFISIEELQRLKEILMGCNINLPFIISPVADCSKVNI